MKNKVVILYIDDEPINTFIFERLVASTFHVLTAHSGAAGLKILQENSETIAAVISDMRMPEMDGLTFISKAKKDFPKILYYILTAFTSKDEIGMGLDESQVDGIFFKPIEPEIIIKEITKKIS